MGEEQVKLFVSMPKSDYDDLMKFKEGLVAKAFVDSKGVWNSIYKIGYVFQTPSEVNDEMIEAVRVLNNRVDELEKHRDLLEKAYVKARRTWWMKLLGL